MELKKVTIPEEKRKKFDEQFPDGQCKQVISVADIFMNEISDVSKEITNYLDGYKDGLEQLVAMTGLMLAAKLVETDQTTRSQIAVASANALYAVGVVNKEFQHSKVSRIIGEVFESALRSADRRMR